MKFFKTTNTVRAIFLVALSLAAYWPVFHAGFIWDDDAFLTNNPLIHASDGLYRFWFTNEPPDYFPLTSTMLWIEWRLWGMNPAGYHTVNVILHILSSLLIWRVMKRLEIPGAWLAGLIFAVHPVNVETVAWITERKNTLPMVLYLFSLDAWLRFDNSGNRRWYILSLVGFLAALLAKTSVVMLPVVMLGCVWWRRGVVSKADVVRVLPFFALSLAMGLLSLWFQTHLAIGQTLVRTDGFFSRLAVAGMAVWFYLYKAALPVNLAFVYPRWEIDPASVVVYLPLVSLIFCAALFWRYRHGWGRGPLFALCYYTVSLFPVLGFFNIYFMRYSLVADHWQYVGIVGPIGLAAAAATQARTIWTAWPRGVWQVAAGTVVAVLAGLSWNQTLIYRNQETLWQDTITENPKASMAYINLGMLREKSGKKDEAFEYYEKGLQADPRNFTAHYNVGCFKRDQGRYDEAEMHFREAIRYHPGYSFAYNEMGMIAAKQGRYREAMDHFGKAVELNPQDEIARSNFAYEMARAGNLSEAIKQFQKAVELAPGYTRAHYNLARALVEAGRPAEALPHINQVKLKIPDNPEVVACLCKAHWLLGEKEQAMRYLKDLKRLAPQSVEALVHWMETVKDAKSSP